MSRLYGTGEATISDLKKMKNKDSLLKYSSKLDSEEGSKKHKTLWTANNLALENDVYVWFTLRRSLGKTLSGPHVCEKAL